MIVKKVLLVIPTYLPILGGAELAVHNIAKSLNKAGIQADVLTFNINGERWKTKSKTQVDTVEGIKVYRIGGFNLLFFTNGKFKSFLMRYFGVQIIPNREIYKIAQQYDVIHLNDEVNLSIPFFLRKVNKKKVFHLRTFAQLYNSFTNSPFSSKTLSSVTEKFIVETDKYNAMLDGIGITPERRIPWRKGVNTEVFIKKEVEKKEGINILSIGRFSDKQKGFHVVVEAISQLDKKINLTLVTPDYRENDFSKQLDKDIAEAIEKENISIKVIKNIPQHQLVDYYNQADLFVFTPTEDSMPNVLLEASSCEVPIITTKVGGIPNLVIDGETGIVLPPNDVEIVRKSIEELWSNPAKRSEIGRKARVYVEEKYSIKKAIQNLVAIYNSL